MGGEDFATDLVALDRTEQRAEIALAEALIAFAYQPRNPGDLGLLNETWELDALGLSRPRLRQRGKAEE
jgi:hypothetical protein